MAQQIQIRRDTASNWTNANPVLAQGEIGLETNTEKIKFGDGIKDWNSLDYFRGDVQAALDGKVDKVAGKQLSTEDFTSSEKTKLSGIETGAEVNTVTSVNTRTGAVTGLAEASDLTAHTSNTSNPHSVTKAQVGLGSVSNLAPADMPVSTAQQTALNAKANASDTVNITGNQTVAGVKTFSSSPIVPNATADTQVVNKAQMDTADALKVNKAGDTMTGQLIINTPTGANGGLRVQQGSGPGSASTGIRVTGGGSTSSANFWLDNTDQTRISASSNGSGNISLNQEGNGSIFMNGIRYTVGTGTPEATVTAPIGSRYVDKNSTNGVALWVKQTGAGNTGWKAVLTQDSISGKADRDYVDIGRSGLKFMQPSSILTNFQTGHGFTTTGTATVNLNDTSTFIRGSQSVSITTNGDGPSAYIRLNKELSPTLDLTNSSIRVLVKIDNPENLGELSLSVGDWNGSSLRGYFYWRRTGGSPKMEAFGDGDWRWFTFKWSDVFQGNGSYSLSADKTPSQRSGFNYIRLYVSDSGAPVTLHVQSIEIMPVKTIVAPRAVSSVAFDDGWASVYTQAFPIMQTYGMRGTVYVIAELIGKPGRMTLAQLKELQSCGWEIAAHSMTTSGHAGFNLLSSQQLRVEMSRLKSWLVNNGFPAKSIAYPHGNVTKTTDGVPIKNVVSEYFNNGRTVYGIEFTETLIETIPAMEPMKLHSLDSISDWYPVNNPRNPTNIISSTGLLQRTVREGGWFIQSFHDITSAPASATDKIKSSEFNMLMAAVASSGVDILTVSEVIDRYHGGINADARENVQSARLVPVPVTATSPGSIGEVAVDLNYTYICVATNVWKRTAISTW